MSSTFLTLLWTVKSTTLHQLTLPWLKGPIASESPLSLTPQCLVGNLEAMLGAAVRRRWVDEYLSFSSFILTSCSVLTHSRGGVLRVSTRGNQCARGSWSGRLMFSSITVILIFQTVHVHVRTGRLIEVPCTLLPGSSVEQYHAELHGGPLWGPGSMSGQRSLATFWGMRMYVLIYYSAMTSQFHKSLPAESLTVHAGSQCGADIQPDHAHGP